MQRKIHMQDQVRNRVAEIMEDRRSDCVIAWGDEGFGDIGDYAGRGGLVIGKYGRAAVELEGLF